MYITNDLKIRGLIILVVSLALNDWATSPALSGFNISLFVVWSDYFPGLGKAHLDVLLAAGWRADLLTLPLLSPLLDDSYACLLGDGLAGTTLGNLALLLPGFRLPVRMPLC